MLLTGSSIPAATLAIPQTQNTAPVIEFNCLYTHDIRRKSKRWQDGFLRFHTFNKRVMVYDIPRNYIGDTHLMAGRMLTEGDDLRLDKGGVLVEVADEIRRTEADLSNIIKVRNPATASSPLRSSSMIGPPASTRQALQDVHRSLNALLGYNRAPIGKAMLSATSSHSIKSPFETRTEQQRTCGWVQPPPPKRSRLDFVKEDQQPAKAIARSRADNQKVTRVIDESVETKRRDHETSRKEIKTDSSLATKQCREAHSTHAEIIDLLSDDQIEPGPLHTQRASKSKTKSGHVEAINARAQAIPHTVHETKQSGSSKRLQVARLSSKRNTLACIAPAMPEEDGITRQLQEKLARIPQVKPGSAVSTTTDPQHPTSKERIVNNDRDRAPCQTSTPQRDQTNDAAAARETPNLLLCLNNDDALELCAIDIDNERAPIVEKPVAELQLQQDEVSAVPQGAELTDSHAAVDVAFLEEVAAVELLTDEFDGTANAADVEAEGSQTTSMRGQGIAEITNMQPTVSTGQAIDGVCPRGLSIELLTSSAILIPSGDTPEPQSSTGKKSNLVSNDSRSVRALDVFREDSQPVNESRKINGIALQDPEATSLTPAAPDRLVDPQRISLQQRANDSTESRRTRRHGVGRLGVNSNSTSSFKPPKLSANPSNSMPIANRPTTTEPTATLLSTAESGAWSEEARWLLTWRPPQFNEDSWSFA